MAASIQSLRLVWLPCPAQLALHLPQVPTPPPGDSWETTAVQQLQLVPHCVSHLEVLKILMPDKFLGHSARQN